MIEYDEKKDPKFVDMMCGCGKMGVYDMGDGTYSCNKYHRCPSYNDLNELLRQCRKDLHTANSKLTTIKESRDIINELD